MTDYQPLRFKVEVEAEEVANYSDMRLRMIIRKAVVNATANDLSLDEAIEVLENEALYLRKRLEQAK